MREESNKYENCTVHNRYEYNYRPGMRECIQSVYDTTTLTHVIDFLDGVLDDINEFKSGR